MQFKPFYTTAEKLDSLAKVPGQFIVVTDRQTIYFDISSSERIDISSGVNMLTNNIYWNNDTIDTVDDLTPYYSKMEIDDKIGTIVTLMTQL